MGSSLDGSSLVIGGRGIAECETNLIIGGRIIEGVKRITKGGEVNKQSLGRRSDWDLAAGTE